MQAPQRGDMEQRPLIVVAERSETAEEGPRLMDFAVACYRLRWPFLLVWVSTVVVSLIWMPLSSKDRFTWTFVVSVTDPVATQAPTQSRSQYPSQDLQPLMNEWLVSIAASGGPSMELNYLRVNPGSKSEILKTGLVASAVGDAEQPPEGLVQLRSVAETWTSRQASQWQELQKDILVLVRNNRDSIAAERGKGSSSGDLVSAELAVAQTEALSRFVPEYRISEPQSARVPSNFKADLVRRAVTCGAIAAGVVLAMSGWSRLRKAAASR